MNKFIGIILGILFLISAFGSFGSSANVKPTFELIPEADGTGWVDDVKTLSQVKSSGNFFDIYNKTASDYSKDADDDFEIKQCSGLGEQFASGIMNRDTVLCMASQIVRFVSNMGLVVGSLMIVYAGYIYASSVFSGKGVDAGTTAIKYAIIGIVVIIFSYAILRTLISAFL